MNYIYPELKVVPSSPELIIKYWRSVVLRQREEKIKREEYVEFLVKQVGELQHQVSELEQHLDYIRQDALSMPWEE